MAEDKLPLRQLRPQRLRERREPLLPDARLLRIRHERRLLPVDVDPVQVVGEHELRHRVRERRRVEALRRRQLRRPERGHDERHARGVVLLLELRAARRVERGPFRRLVGRSRAEQEGQVAEGVCMREMWESWGRVVKDLHDVEALDLVERREHVGTDSQVGIHDKLGAGRDDTGAALQRERRGDGDGRQRREEGEETGERRREHHK